MPANSPSTRSRCGPIPTCSITSSDPPRPWCRRCAAATPRRVLTARRRPRRRSAPAYSAVLGPVSRVSSAPAGGSEGAVYRDQLAEIDRDVAAGLIGASEAEAARVEIGRRLLAAADGQRDLPARSNLGLRRASAIVALVGLPIAAVTFYLSFGSPRLGDFPLASRTRTADVNQPLDNMVAQVEAHLEKNPTDGRGWTVLAPVLARLGRYDDAVRAYRNSITYAGDSAERRSDPGAALAGAASRG